MLGIIVNAYLVGWIAAIAVVFTASNRLCEPGLAVSYRLALSVVAGFVWPLLLIGAIEFTSLVWYSRARRHANTTESCLDIDARQTTRDVVPIR